MYATSMLAGLALAFALAPDAHAQMMFKCTSADGTIAYQQKPCAGGAKEARVAPKTVAPDDGRAATTSIVDGRVVARAAPDDTQRAVEARAERQRLDRCRNARDTLERQQALLASPATSSKKSINDEIRIQERRLAEDRCA